MPLLGGATYRRIDAMVIKRFSVDLEFVAEPVRLPSLPADRSNGAENDIANREICSDVTFRARRALFPLTARYKTRNIVRFRR